MQKCDKIFDFAATSRGLDDQKMPGRQFHGISEKFYTHTQTPKMRLTPLVKLRKNENYFSSKLKTDGNIVFDPFCDSLRS